MKKYIFISFICLTSMLSAQSPNEMVRKIQNKFNSINNFTASFQQIYFSANDSEGGKVTGNFYYKKKNKFIVELKSRTIVSDGENVWNYDKKYNRVIISYAQDDPTAFSLEKFIFDYPPLCRAKLIKDDDQTSKTYVLELTPKDNDLQFKLVRIWKSDDNFISKMEMTDLGDMKYSFSFSDIKINQDIPDSKFVYYPNKGTKVIDLR